MWANRSYKCRWPLCATLLPCSHSRLTKKASANSLNTFKRSVPMDTLLLWGFMCFLFLQKMLQTSHLFHSCFCFLFIWISPRFYFQRWSSLHPSLFYFFPFFNFTILTFTYMYIHCATSSSSRPLTSSSKFPIIHLISS
jgi:hypothetical protein